MKSVEADEVPRGPGVDLSTHRQAVAGAKDWEGAHDLKVSGELLPSWDIAVNTNPPLMGCGALREQYTYLELRVLEF